MKNWYCFLVFLFLSSFASYGQNVYQHFSELKGMEDYNGNTNLLYRIYSYSYYSYGNEGSDNSIYCLNVSTLKDSVFQRDYVNASYYTGDFALSITDYKFWDKDPSKFIVCGVGTELDPVGFIERFDGWRNTIFPFAYSFIGISQQNDSLVYTTGDMKLIKSLSGGKDWTTVGNFNTVSLSPYDDKILFAVNQGELYKSYDGGLTSFPVDTILCYTNYHPENILYDKDTNYIYRVSSYLIENSWYYKFLVSNNAGNAYSWQDKFTSILPIYLSIDYSIAGSVYLATGKNIYHSTDFGSTFNLFKSFEMNLVGIYKKPGSSKLYAATYNTIYEIDGSTINIIKQIPVDKEIFKFDPLDIGNKWVYNAKFFVPEETYNFVHSEEILRDSILENGQLFKLIRIEELSHNSSSIYYSFRRIDSLTGKVYSWNLATKSERLIDDLSISIGDSINISRFGLLDGPTSFDSLYFKNIFGLSIENHVFSSLTNPLGYGDTYSLTKDFGITYHASSGDQVLTTLSLKGAIIKGVVYGDTAFVVGINDKDPVQPKEFVLFQNFPNPFNPSTTINYSLPKAGNVKLTIYNAIGSKVATIVNEYKPAGNYSVQFNGSNLASGIYLYRLESGNYSAVKKFILLK